MIRADVAKCNGEREDGAVCPHRLYCRRYLNEAAGPYQWYMAAPFEGPDAAGNARCAELLLKMSDRVT